MDLLKLSKSKATVVVGLDFGTTFSGFAYALMSAPDECRLFYEWPGLKAAGAINYCKTQTSLLYSSFSGQSSSSESHVLQGWGYEALVQHSEGKQSQQQNPKDYSHGKSIFGKRTVGVKKSKRRVEHFITRFKLHLAGGEKTSAADLPQGLTPRRTISDYLRKLSELTLVVLKQNLGNHIKMKDIQWCITVPSIWDEGAKREMKTCAEIAGLVQGPQCKDEGASPHPAIIVLEPEAASFYCQEEAGFPLDDGDKFLVVDAGGGTVDLALHEKVGPPWSKKVREVAASSGGLCGGTYVDERFLEFLCQNIRCFRTFAEKNSQIVLSLLSWWETIKRSFDGSMQFNYNLDLPPKLARAWEDDEALNSGQVNAGASYDSIALTLQDMLCILDPVVDQILELIDQQDVPDLKAMMVVGGFAASSYLKRRILAAFSQKLVSGTIIFPEEPGSAICCGAVAYGVGDPGHIMSRVSKKTYGISVARLFRPGDPLHLRIAHGDGYICCRKTFQVFTRKGQSVPVDSCVSQSFFPISEDQTQCEVCLFSTSDTNPAYVTDPGVKEEGSFVVHLLSRNAIGRRFEIKVSIYFGRTTIEVKAEGENFGDGELFTMPPVTFEGAFQRLSLGSRSIGET